MSAVLLATSVLFAAGAPTETTAAREPWCWDVRGTITVSFSSGDCASVVGLCTQGVIDATGFLEGTTRYTATGIGGGVAERPIPAGHRRSDKAGKESSDAVAP
jgi:hypothetical protein